MSRPRWISRQHELEELIGVLATADVYALDTEFHRERTYYPRLALLQLAWEDGRAAQIALVDPLGLDLSPLARVLEGPGLLVAHAAEQDLEVLERACGRLPRRLLDTQLAAGFLGLSSPSLVTLVERVLGVRLPKGDRLTDWTRRPLSQAQQDYAAADVAHLVRLWQVIGDQLEACSRLAWAEEECAELLGRSRQAQEPDTAWWRLKEARQLRGRARAVVATVSAWRERRAAVLDVPPRHVLPDMALVGIAQRPPRSLGELRDVRGLDGRHLRGTVAADLLEAVRRGGELDPALVPAPPADDLDRSLRPAVALATAWVAQLARDLRIDASLLATRADLQALLRGDPDARLSRGWRADLVGRHVRRLVLGEEALAFDGRGGLVLEARSRRPVGPAVAVPSVAWTDEGAGAPLADATAELAERAAELADTADGQ